MNDFEASFLKNNGFVHHVSISRLMNKLTARKSIPEEKGVYIVVSEKPMMKEFLEKGTGGFFKGKDPNVSLMELEYNWVDDSQIFYIGKAGGFKPTGELMDATLQSRIGQLISFGKGNRSPHSGGRYLWQLAFSKKLIIYYRVCPGMEDPRATEAELIKQYKNHYGKWPFANNQD